MSLSLFCLSVPVWLCSQEAFCVAQRRYHHSKLCLTKRTDPEGIDELLQCDSPRPELRPYLQAVHLATGSSNWPGWRFWGISKLCTEWMWGPRWKPCVPVTSSLHSGPNLAHADLWPCTEPWIFVYFHSRSCLWLITSLRLPVPQGIPGTGLPSSQPESCKS